MSGSYGMSSQEASVANEKRLKMQEKIEVLERMIEGQSLGAERDAPREGAGGGAVGGREEKQLRGNTQRRLRRQLGFAPNQACNYLLYTALV